MARTVGVVLAGFGKCLGAVAHDTTGQYMEIGADSADIE